MHVSLMDGLLVILGGGLGGAARLAVAEWAARRLGGGFPWGTLAVNVIGALAIGALAAGMNWPLTTGPGWMLLAVGVLGGFTTVSSFSLQTLALFQERRHVAAMGNILGTLLLGVVAVGLGWWLGGGA